MYGGRNMISRRVGRGRLRAVNPHGSGVLPMTVLGTCILYLILPTPVGRNFFIETRVTGILRRVKGSKFFPSLDLAST